MQEKLLTQSVERDGSRKIGWKTSRVTRFSKCLRARSKWKLKCKSQAAPARGAAAVAFFPTEEHEVRRDIPYSLVPPLGPPGAGGWNASHVWRFVIEANLMVMTEVLKFA